MALFVVNNNPAVGSAIMRGTQLCEGLSETTESSWKTLENCDGQEVAEHIIFVKVHPPVDLLHQLRERGVHIVYDTVDVLCFPYEEQEMVKRFPFYDTIVTNTHRSRMKLYNLGYEGHVFLLPHHWDPRIKAANKMPLDFPLQLGFMGTAKSIDQNLKHFKMLRMRYNMRVLDTESGTDVTNIAHSREMLDERVQHKSNNFDSLYIPFNCHLSVRDTASSEFHYKTNAKVSTAAALMQPIITTREDAAMEVLGPYYPLFIENDSEECLKEKITAIHDNPNIVTNALDYLLELKEKTSLSAISALYKDRLGMAGAVTRYVRYVREVVQAAVSRLRGTRLVYRSMFGNIHDIEMPQTEDIAPDTDYICFIDSDREIAPHYTRVHIDAIEINGLNFKTRRDNASACGTLSNRILKMLLPGMLPDRYVKSIYLDFSASARDSHSDLFDMVTDENPLVAYEHYRRKNAAQEIQIIESLGMITPLQASHITQLYDRLFPGCMDDMLTENNILTRQHSPGLLAAMRTWFQTFLEDIPRDQASLQFVLRGMDIDPKVLYQKVSAQKSEDVHLEYPMRIIFWDTTHDWPYQDIIPEIIHADVIELRGDLPEGLSFDSTTGVISGTPASVKLDRSVTVSCTNETSRKDFHIQFKFQAPKERDLHIIYGCVIGALICSIVFMLVYFLKFR